MKKEKYNWILALILIAFGLVEFAVFCENFILRQAERVYNVPVVNAIEELLVQTFLREEYGLSEFPYAVCRFLTGILFYVPFLGGIIAATKKKKAPLLVFAILLDCQMIITLIASKTRCFGHYAIGYSDWLDNYKFTIIWPEWLAFGCFIAITILSALTVIKEKRN